MSALVGVVNN